MIKFALLPDGGFVCGDTDSGRTGYAYPTSPHATMARTVPERIAVEMIGSANRDNSPASIREDYDCRMWSKLGCRPDVWSGIGAVVEPLA